MMGACDTCLGEGVLNERPCTDCDGAGYFDADGEPVLPDLDPLIAAAVMPIPPLDEDPTWKLLQAATEPALEGYPEGNKNA